MKKANILGRARTLDDARMRAQALADLHNKEMWVLSRWRASGTEYIITTTRQVNGWGFAGKVVSQAMLDSWS